MSETPTHYQGTIQPIEYMRETMTAEEYAGFLKGNIIKYIARAGKKDGETAADDIRKAGQYMDWLEDEYNRRAEDSTIPSKTTLKSTESHGRVVRHISL